MVYARSYRCVGGPLHNENHTLNSANSNYQVGQPGAKPYVERTIVTVFPNVKVDETVLVPEGISETSLAEAYQSSPMVFTAPDTRRFYTQPSSIIKEVHYDVEMGVLDILLHKDEPVVLSESVTGTKASVDLHATATRPVAYRYTDVPLEVFHELLKAESIGRYWSTNIRSTYQQTRL